MFDSIWRKAPRARLRNPHFQRPLRFERLEDRSLLAAIITVNSTADGDIRDSDLTLREAILVNNGTLTFATLTAAEQAQVSGTLASGDTIGFNIAGTGVKTITPTSALPAITDAVIIDGYTQGSGTPTTADDAKPNTLAIGNDAVLLIELSGVSAGTVDGLTITAGGSTVQGLVINGFARAFGASSDEPGGRGILLRTNGGNFIQGNFIGTNALGTTAVGNDKAGVFAESSSNNVIGGTTPAARNLISGHSNVGGIGVSIGAERFGVAGNSNIVQGNYIGTDRNGVAALANHVGLVLSGTNDNTIGGTVPGAGNVISGHTVHGIVIESSAGGSSASGNKVQGNFIGLDASGTFAIPNRHAGIFIVNTFGNVIGGDDDDDGALDGVVHARNIISGNGLPGNAPAGGVSIATGTTVAQPNFILGNFIGTDVTGTLAVGNSFGVVIGGEPAPNVVGGPAAGAGNLISGNVEGVRLAGGQVGTVLVQGNRIGTQADGVSPLGNGLGIITNTTNNTIGGSVPGEGNVIAFNGNFGVAITSDGAPGTGNAILGNSIHSNDGLGIDLILNGNNAQTFPVLTSVITTATTTTITGTLNSTPNQAFRIEFFASAAVDPTCFGEGQTFLGFKNVTTDAGGNVTFTATTAADGLLPAPAGQAFVTSTATNTPTNDTSEFSRAFELPSLVVTTIADVIANDCQTSLREAITFANSHLNNLNPGGVADVISFNIPGAGVKTIAPGTALPAITDAVILDAYTQPGSSANTSGPALGTNAVLLVEINFANAGGVGFRINADNSTLRGLVINGSPNFGIIVGTTAGSFGAGAVIEGNFIGTNPAGTAAGPANGGGVLVQANDALIGGTTPAARNLISGNGGGIAIGSSFAGNFPDVNTVPSNARVQGNLIGTNAAGTAGINQSTITPSGTVGVDIFEFGGNHVIGGATAASRNIISGFDVGVQVRADFTTALGTSKIQGNYIGLDVTGVAAIPNRIGVQTANQKQNNVIGGVVAGEGNVISGSREANVRLGSLGNVVQGNFIGTNATGAAAPTGLPGAPSSNFGIDVLASNNTIGGAAAGAGNVIAFNAAQGVFVDDINVVNVAILGNSIFSNGRLGIDLLGKDGPGGVNPNNSGPFNVANQGQNYPVITGVAGSVISATLNSVPSTAFRIEFFASDAADPSGFGEGQTFLGSTLQATDVNGNTGTFTFDASPTLIAGKFISATATRRSVSGPAIETSEFSASMAVGGGPLPTLTVVDGAILEGNPGGDQRVPFILSLSAVSSVDVSGTVSTSLGAGGPAANEGMDFVSADGMAFTIPAGQTQTTVFVSIIEDTTAEQLEQFLLTAVADNVSNPNGSATGTGTIQNDDTAFFSINDMTVNEGAGLLMFTVSLSNPIDIDVSVNVSYSDITTSLSDFVHISSSLIFPENSTAPQIVGVSITNDSLVESTETFLASLTADSNASSGRSIDTSDTGIGTITDNDTAVIAPTVTINQAAGQIDPTSSSPILFTVVFSAPVTGFIGSDVSFAGSTVGGTLVANVTGSGANYTVSVTGMIGNGTVVASIGAGAAMNASNTPSAASSSTDNSITFTTPVVAPTVTINQAAGQADPTSSGPILFTVVFSQAVTGFTGSDVSLAGSTAGGTLVANVSGSGANYTVSVTGMTGSGTVVASISAAAAMNANSTPSAASTSTDNTVTVTTAAPQATTLIITLVARQAKFKNEFGLYFVDDAAGRIGTLVPGDAGYARAAIGRTKAVFTTRDKIGSKRTVNLPAGGFYGTYIVQNATRSSFLARNPLNRLNKKPLMFFSFVAANPDGFDHVRRPAEARFAFEDQTRGGDMDFNDSVVDVREQAAVLEDVLSLTEPVKRK